MNGRRQRGPKNKLTRHRAGFASGRTVEITAIFQQESNERPYTGETEMDTYREDSARTSRFANVVAPEDAATHRRWARAMLGFYCTLILLVGVAIFASQLTGDSSNRIAQASTRQSPH
jgi:hypothetical protein